MNIVGDIEEVTADQLTTSYVYHLKSTLKTKHEECLSLQKSNTKLSQKILELEEKLKLIEAQRDFEIRKCNLAMQNFKTASSTSPCHLASNPNEIVRIVTSWFPEHVHASVACCIKAEESWIIVEEKNECQRIPHSSLLDDVVLCCALSDDGFSETEVIPEAILRSLGWSPLHKSLAVTVYSGCVWVIIGINFQDIKNIIPGFNSLLHISTEMIISRVMNLLQENEALNNLSRVQVSLEIWKLLLQPTCGHFSPSLSLKKKKREKKDLLILNVDDTCSSPMTPSGPSIRTSEDQNLVQTFHEISLKLQESISELQCEVFLFCEKIHSRGSNSTWAISSMRGTIDRIAMGSKSLTEKVISEKVDFHSCLAGDNLSSIDLGENLSEISLERLANSSLVIAPIWKESCCSHNFRVTGAIIFRSIFRTLTESELNLLHHISRDTVPIIRQWLEGNLDSLLHQSKIPIDNEIPNQRESSLDENLEKRMSTFVHQVENLFHHKALSQISDQPLNEFSFLEDQTRAKVKENLYSLMKLTTQMISHFIADNSYFNWNLTDGGIYLEPVNSSSTNFVRDPQTRPFSRYPSPRLPQEWNLSNPGHTLLSTMNHLTLYANHHRQIGVEVSNCSLILVISLKSDSKNTIGTVLILLESSNLHAVNQTSFTRMLLELDHLASFSEMIYRNEIATIGSIFRRLDEHYHQQIDFCNQRTELSDQMKTLISESYISSLKSLQHLASQFDIEQSSVSLITSDSNGNQQEQSRSMKLRIQDSNSFEIYFDSNLERLRKILQSQHEQITQLQLEISRIQNSQIDPKASTAKLIEKIQERLRSSSSSYFKTEISEENIVESIADLSQLLNYSTLFLQNIIDNVCSRGLSQDLTQWFCSTSSSLSLYSKTSQVSPLCENWSIIWLDHYETLQNSSIPIYDFDTFQEVLETKQPNYINLVEYEDGVSFQIFYWPLFAEKNVDHMDESLKFHPPSESSDASIEDRSVIGILQCRIRKDSADKSTFLEQSLSQSLFLTYFNTLISHIYPHISESGVSDEDQHQKEVSVADPDTIDSTDESQIFLPSSFYSDMTSLLHQISIWNQQSGSKSSQEILNNIAETIWVHSTHTQVNAVGVFILDDSTNTYSGAIRSLALRSIQVNDDEENMSISIHINPNSRLTECQLMSRDLIDVLSADQPYERISIGSSILTQFVAVDSVVESDLDESLATIYRLIIPINVSPSDGSSANHHDYLVAEYSFTPPKPAELLFLKFIGSILQSYHNNYSWSTTQKNLEQRLTKYIADAKKHRDNSKNVMSELENVQKFNKFFERMKQELIFPPPFSSDTRDDASYGHDWSELWFSEELKDKKKTQNFLKSILKRIETNLSELNIDRVSSSSIISIEMNSVQEIKDLIVHEFRKLSVKFSEIFSMTRLTALLIEGNGDVVYIPNSLILSDRQVLMKLNPLETSQSHLLALSLVCNSIVSTEKGFNGMTETHQYYPIGVYTNPLGAWGIVTTDSRAAPDHSFLQGNSFIHSIAQELSRWFQSAESYRLGRLSMLGLKHNRDFSHQIGLLHNSILNLISTSAIHSIPSLAAGLENILITKYFLQSHDNEADQSPSQQFNFSIQSGKLHWLDAASSKWCTVEVDDQQPQHSYHLLSENRYRIIPSSLGGLVLNQLKSRDMLMTDWNLTSSKSVVTATVYLKIDIEYISSLNDGPAFSPSKPSQSTSHRPSEYVLELSCQLTSDSFSQTAPAITHTQLSIPCIDLLNSILHMTKVTFRYLITTLHVHHQSNLLHQENTLQISTLVKQFVSVMHLLDTLYSKSQATSPSDQSKEVSRIGALLNHVEDILSSFRGLRGCEISCEDSTENINIYQSPPFSTKNQVYVHTHQATVIHTPSSDSDGYDSKSKHHSLYLSNVSDLTPMTNYTLRANHSLMVSSPLPSTGHPLPVGAPPYANISSSAIKKPSFDTESDGDDRVDRFVFGTHDSPQSYPSVSSPSPNQALHSYPIKFQVYEVRGSITFYSTSLLTDEMLSVLTTLVRVIGRRIYELYRGKRNKKLLVTVQKDYEKTRKHLEQRNTEFASLQANYSNVLDEIRKLELINERLKSSSKIEETNLSTKLQQALKSEYEHVIENMKREADTTIHTQQKTIESLKSQCEHLASLIREDDQHIIRSKEVETIKKELEYAVERAAKAERRKRELASELLEQRTKNELIIHDLEGKVSQYENDIKQQLQFEQKLREAYQITEDHLRKAKNRLADLEEEVMARRSSSNHLKQQLQSTTRALQMNQEEFLPTQQSTNPPPAGSSHPTTSRNGKLRSRSPVNKRKVGS